MGTGRYSHVEQAAAFEPTDGFTYLREQCPVFHEEAHEPSFYVLSRFNDVRDALKSPNQWLNQFGGGVYLQPGGVLGSADDPDHARQRRVLRDSFVQTRTATLEPAITRFADDLLDAMLPRGRGDFVEELAFPLPAAAIAEVLGVPHEDHHRFHAWTHRIVAGLTGGDITDYHAARSEVYEYVAEIVDERGRQLDTSGHAGDDVMGVMTVAERGGQLSRHEVQHLGHQLLVAGHETTTGLLGMMLFRLLERPELMARVRADHTLIPAVIEEALRFDSPVTGLFRTSAEACPMHGVDIPQGTKLQMLYASANRDPERFERADEFDIDRDPNELRGHLAFGWGVHHCIGAPLARLTARVALERLLARTTTIELDGEPRRNASFVLHGLVALPIRWE